ncbi:periplasmic nitrate reductase component NapD [Thioalkalivibrio nitratireducens DSM 14787]|uniref:Chaperone NapD n=2 Tax=Thioalkalivibrio nitratireducens TaxID=186931 RepID=L0DXC2_THIND|nr:periplasmic nitrate reductase component NapD [Thioalkalivibrio nitratireducens DSM 14787]
MMNLSGIVVICPPERLESVASALRELSGVEVHYQDRDQGKIVVVQEALSIEAEMNGLRRIKALPAVILADMLYHYFEEDPEILEGLQNVRRNRPGKGPDISSSTLPR